MSASTPNLIKQVNLQCVRSALLELKSATKPQLAEYTSLSVITINALIRYLKETGEVLEDSMTHPGLGRPAMSYKLNEEFCMALIIYTFEKDGQDTAFLSCGICMAIRWRVLPSPSPWFFRIVLIQRLSHC